MGEIKKTEREKYIDKLTAKLKEWDRELDELEDKFDKRFDELKNNYQTKIDNLKSAREKIKAKLNKLKESSEDAFLPVKKRYRKTLGRFEKWFKKNQKR